MKKNLKLMTQNMNKIKIKNINLRKIFKTNDLNKKYDLIQS